ncbi:hypothetical protein Mapa_017719 [Marchantia paleacea]|nr:hypothetical protein Mapa_017719 [Marchantia paleacea]
MSPKKMLDWVTCHSNPYPALRYGKWKKVEEGSIDRMIPTPGPDSGGVCLRSYSEAGERRERIVRGESLAFLISRCSGFVDAEESPLWVDWSISFVIRRG